MMEGPQHPTREQAREMLRAYDNNPEKIKEWNAYRKKHPEWKPDLSDHDDPGDFSELTLGYTDKDDIQHGIDLAHAIIPYANLSGANLEEANLSGARLDYGNLSEADLFAAKLEGAGLADANLSGADLPRTNLSEAVLFCADLSEADLVAADLRNADVTMLTYDRKRMPLRCLGVRVATCYGNALFRRDAMDQDFIDTLDEKRDGDLGQARKALKSGDGPYLKLAWRYRSAQVRWALFRAWGWIDYGRSMARTAGLACLAAFVFGLVFLLADWSGYPMLYYDPHAPDWILTPFYYSIVTYTTLGFGDVIPATKLGQVVVIFEVIAGYLTLGLLVSILANKVARRS